MIILINHYFERNSKMKASQFSILILTIAMLLTFSSVSNGEPAGSTIVHEGNLTDGGNPTNDTVDFVYKLYDSLIDGIQVGPIVDANDVNVIDGQFNVQLDFGIDVFNGEARWLASEVQGSGDDRYTRLSPRQKLMPVPYSIYAQNSGAIKGIDEISTDGTLADNSDTAIPTEKAVKTYVDNQTVGTVPVGSVISWLKSFPNTPSLPDNFVECNGQTLSDVDSPYNGQLIPNLNGASGAIKRFLRGSMASGSTGGSDTHSHGLQLGNTTVTSGSPGYCKGIYGSSNVPSYYEVVWVMRIR